ncbi:MAG: hypothetical protein ACXVCP_03765 [Bdellovibrio sp.]
MRSKFSVVLISLFFISNSLFCSAFAAEKKNQLEELLIWKMSDELKLTSVEEKKFTDILKELNKKKTDLNHSMQSSVDKMAKANSAKQKESELVSYRKSLQNYSRINEEEFDRLKPVLGADRMIQYLVIKQDLTNRIKTMLINPEANSKDSSNKSLPQPKLIEEK